MAGYGWGVEVYGGPILATFSDRELSLAGRISFKTNQGALSSRLVRFDTPLLRLPNLAIHMNRTVNEEGLKFQKQTELPLLLKAWVSEQLPKDYFYQLIEQSSGVPKADIMSLEFAVYDTQKGGDLGK